MVFVTWQQKRAEALASIRKDDEITEFTPVGTALGS